MSPPVSVPASVFGDRHELLVREARSTWGTDGTAKAFEVALDQFQATTAWGNWLRHELTQTQHPVEVLALVAVASSAVGHDFIKTLGSQLPRDRQRWYYSCVGVFAGFLAKCTDFKREGLRGLSPSVINEMLRLGVAPVRE